MTTVRSIDVDEIESDALILDLRAIISERRDGRAYSDPRSLAIIESIEHLLDSAECVLPHDHLWDGTTSDGAECYVAQPNPAQVRVGAVDLDGWKAWRDANIPGGE